MCIRDRVREEGNYLREANVQTIDELCKYMKKKYELSAYEAVSYTHLDVYKRQDQDSPFFKADLYKKYFTLDYIQILTGEEKSGLEEHGPRKI